MEPQQNLNSYQTLASMFRSEMKEGVAPVWSYEESLLLEQQLARPDVTGDDLQIVLSIAPWFPHKSIQQISLRMRWVRLQTMQSWEDFCKTNDTRHRPNLSIQPDSPRENMSYSSNHSSNHSSPRKIDAATRRDSFRTTKSEEYLKQQKKFIGRGMVHPPYRIDSHNTTMYTPSVDHSIKRKEDVESLISENEQTLAAMQRCLLTGNELSESKNEIIHFGLNIRHLLGLTEEIAKPHRLPFLPLLLDIPSDMVDIPQQVQIKVQQRQEPHSQTNNFYI